MKKSMLFIVIMIGVLLTSCQSKSVRLLEIPLEKVVIIDSYNTIDLDHGKRMYQYKVNRIERGVVAVIYQYNRYEANDTIYHRFLNEGI